MPSSRDMDCDDARRDGRRREDARGRLLGIDEGDVEEIDERSTGDRREIDVEEVDEAAAEGSAASSAVSGDCGVRRSAEIAGGTISGDSDELVTALPPPPSGPEAVDQLLSDLDELYAHLKAQHSLQEYAAGV